MARPKHDPGDVLDLSWEDGRPDWYAVYGHVSAWVFRDAWDDHQDEPGWTASNTSEPRETWARWEMAGQDEDGNPARCLMLRAGPGPGCFRVTVAYPELAHAAVRTTEAQREPGSFSLRMVSVEAEGSPEFVAGVLGAALGVDRG